MESLKTNECVILRDEQTCAVFIPENMRLFTLDSSRDVSLTNIYQWLRKQGALNVPADVGDSKDDNGANQNDPLNLSYREAMLPMMLEHKALDEVGIIPKINRFTLNISNDCNLQCSYCYADHGNYHSPQAHMSVDSARLIVNKIIDAYREVDIVHFFGGEPLLNIAVVDAVCAMFHDAHQKGKLQKCPIFVATTNGTLASRKILQILKKWDIELTVSWDGPKAIHDQARPTKKANQSSHDQLLTSLQKFDSSGIHYEIECTYNFHHANAGISVSDLMRYFWEQTGKRSFHIVPVSQPEVLAETDPQLIFRGEALKVMHDNLLSQEMIIPQYRQAAAITVDNLFSGEGPMLSLAGSITEQILSQRKSSIYCPAFFNQLSVAIDGAVFPCFMFVGDERFRLGNILTDRFPTNEGLKIFKRYYEEFGLSSVGTDEWYAPLFSGCVAGEYIATNNLSTRSSKSLYEAMIEECLLRVASYSMRGVAVPNGHRAQMSC